MLCLCLAALFWGLSFVATKAALAAFPPMALLFLRFAGGSAFFALFLARQGVPRISLRLHLRILLTSLFLPGAYFVCETYGIQATSASKASLIVATIPITVLAGSALFLGERPRPWGYLGVLLSLIGVSLLVLGGREAGALGGLALGDLLMFGAVAAATGYMILAREIGRELSSLVFTAMQMFYGLIFFAPFFLVRAGEVQWSAVGFWPWASLAGLTCFATVGAFIAYNYALSKVPASHAALFINAVPAVTAVAAWLLLGERLTSIQIMGGAIVVLSVYLATYAGARSLPLKRLSSRPDDGLAP